MNTKRMIAFIGVGLMGRGMARSLIRRGHTVCIYNRTRSKAEEVAELGGTVADTPAEATSGAEVIVTMLADLRRRSSGSRRRGARNSQGHLAGHGAD